MCEEHVQFDDMEVQCIQCNDWVDSIGAEEGDMCSSCEDEEEMEG